MTITGTNLSGATSVKFGSASATSFTVNASNSITATSPFGSTNATSFTVNSATSITATSPAGSGTVDVTVTTPGGTSATSSADQFSYIAEPPPTVTAIKPTKGRAAGGTTVTITGSGFTGTISVKFGSTAATSFVVDSDSQAKAVSPAGTGTVNVTVTTPHGTSAITSADQYTYQVEAPTITKLSPTHGPIAGGTTVTVTGTNFATGSGTVFKFGSKTGLNANCTSTTSCTVLAPAAAKGKAATVEVIASVGTAKSKKVAADRYTYE